MLFLQRLVLEDFRNYETLDLNFGPGRLLLLGDNGQGKTNLLEAIHFLGLLRSCRGSKLDELRRWRQPRFTIRGEFMADGQRLVLGVEYGEQRRLRVDGQPVRRASDFIGRVPLVAFVPEDIELVKGPASGRRRFLDIGLTGAAALPGRAAGL
jgi:DNA replication and repair protein RecF